MVEEPEASQPAQPEDAPPGPSVWRWLVFGCVGCGLFSVCLVTAFVILAALGSEAAKEDSVRAAHRHLELVRKAEVPAAYGATAPQFQSATDLKTFEAFVAQQGGLYQASDVTFDQRQVSDDTATLRGHATGADGTKTAVTFVVVNVEGTWMVRDIKLGR